MQLYVLGSIDDTHTATAQLLDDAEVGDRPPGEWRRIGHRRESYAAPNGKSTRRRQKLLQLRVLGLGLLKDGNVGVGVFPEGECFVSRTAGSEGGHWVVVLSSRKSTTSASVRRPSTPIFLPSGDR